MPATGHAVYRARQVLRQIDWRSTREVDHALRALVDPEEWRLLARLGPADRRHALAVHRKLIRQGWTDADLLKAALLHDIGKADGITRAGTTHRVIKVMAARIAPAFLARIATRQHGWLRHGLYLSVHHASLGAMLAREAGNSERACWLIEHHDDGTIAGDLALAALQSADAEE